MNDTASAPTRKLPALRRLLRLAMLLGFIYVGVVVLFVSLQRSFIYAPTRGPAPASLSDLPPSRIRDLRVPGADGLTLHGWLTHPPAEATEETKFLVILFPGNAGYRPFRLGILDGFNQLGCDALICDYRGYAENDGNPSEEGFARDAREIWKYAREELGYPAERIILCGESMGGGVAVRLAWDLAQQGIEPGGLILRTTFASLVETASHLYPWLPIRTFIADRYPSAERIGQIHCPILVIHGQQDRIVPFAQGQKLFDAAPPASRSGVPKRLLALPEAGHNDVMLVSAAQIHQAHHEFLSALREAQSEVPQ